MSVNKRMKTDVKDGNCDLKNQSTVSINCLPDSCLLRIFKNLYWKDLIKIEQVCEKWRTISLMAWSSVKKIYFGYSVDSEYKSNIKRFKDILSRGGNYITHLHIHQYNMLNPDETFAVINKYCKKLEHFELNWCFRLVDVDFKNLSPQVIQNLKTLHIISIHHMKSLPYLLKKAVNIEDLSFKYSGKYTISSIRNLTDKCKEADLNFCKFYNKDQTIELFQKLKNLEKLHVTNTNIFPEALVPLSDHLVSLTLASNTTAFFKDNSYENYLCMPNLKTLCVRKNVAVNDEVISTFHKCFPSLENLILKSCYKINLEPRSCLGRCKKLKYLDISKTDVQDEGLAYIAAHLSELETLKCDFCMMLTEKGFATVVSLKKLKQLSTICCTGARFTNRFLKAASNSAKLRTEDTPLEVSTDVYMNDSDKKRFKLTNEENAPTSSKNLIISVNDEPLYVVDSEEE